MRNGRGEADLGAQRRDHEGSRVEHGASAERAPLTLCYRYRVPGTPGKTTTFFRRSHFILMKRGGEGVIAEKLLSGFLRCKLSFRISYGFTFYGMKGGTAGWSHTPTGTNQ